VISSTIDSISSAGDLLVGASVDVADATVVITDTAVSTSASDSALATASESAVTLETSAEPLAGTVAETLAPASQTLEAAVEPVAAATRELGEALAALSDGGVTNLAIAGLISSLGYTWASGLGIGDLFVRPVLEPCASSLRTTFRAMKLVPCPAAASASAGSAAVDSGPPSRRGLESLQANEPPQTQGVAIPLSPKAWRIPHYDDLLLRLFGGMLAALSALLAALGGLRHEQRERQLRQYRRRLHS
jgi:hypothetical protein